MFAEAGKTIVTSNHLFGNTYALITKTLARLGVKAQIADLTDTETLDSTIADDACLIFAEYITNPQLEVVDLKKLSQVAHKHGVPLIVDTTIVPFTELNAREQGVDVEVLSSTKYISGGATSLGGLILDYGTFEQVNKRIRFEFLFNIGSYMTPQVAYMQTLVASDLLSNRFVARRMSFRRLMKSKHFCSDSRSMVSMAPIFSPCSRPG